MGAAQQFDLLGSAATNDPYGVLKDLRSRGSVQWNDLWHGWLALDHATVSEVLRSQAFSVERLPRKGEVGDEDVEELFDAMRMWLSFREGPSHRHDRRWLGNYVRHPDHGSIGRFVRELAQDEASALCDRDAPFNFVDEYSIRFSNAVIAEVLGVPIADRPLLSGWAEALKPVVHSDPLDHDRFKRAAAAYAEIIDYVSSQMRQANEHPPATMFHALAESSTLDDRQRSAVVAEWIFGGNETTSSALSSAVLCLVEVVDDLDELLSENLLEATCEEILRYEPPLKSTARVVVEPHVLGGQLLEPGDRVLALIAAANRDETVFEAADDFRPRRSRKQSLTFGLGQHFCLGAELARLELREAVSALHAHGVLERLTVKEVSWVRSIVARAPSRLMVEIG